MRDDALEAARVRVAHEDPESVFARLPLLAGERDYDTFRAHGACFAYAIATWCFLLGSYAADFLGAVEGTVCLIAGNVIGTFLCTMPLSLGCQRYGLEQMDFCKTAFGQRGSHVLILFYLINMLGWSGLLLVMFGNGIFNLAAEFGLEPGQWLVGTGVALGIWISYLIATRGVHRLGVVAGWVTPSLALLVLYMVYRLVSVHGWDNIAAAAPLDPTPDPAINYAIVLELGIANGFSWWGGIGFLARNTRTQRNSVYPEILQLGLMSGLVSSVALFAALTIGSDDPTEWMIPLGGLFMGTVALICIGMANITAVSLSIFASGLALRHVPFLRMRPWWQVIVVTIIPCCFFIFWAQELYDLGASFLAYNGTMYAPIAGIVFVDFFLLRRQRVCLRSIFDNDPKGDYWYWKGFNLLGLGGIVLGQFVYFFLFDPIDLETHWLFTYVPASLGAFIVPALMYWVGMRLQGVKVEPDAADTRLRLPNI
ncbi:MAG: cytosine permease [Gammaproteobacteria bacterium]|nr:cytosine permease [Gammaproteobacteria bacterium]